MPERKNKNLAESIRQRFAPLGGVELELPKRDSLRQLPALDPRLVTASATLSKLIMDVPRLGDLLDLAAGALASLIKANQLEYQDRKVELPPEYYPKLSERVRKMGDGTLPPRGLWISGYYFNSALLRLAAGRDQLRRVLSKVNKQRPGAVQELPTDDLHEEGGRLKHQLSGLKKRNVQFDNAVEALEEMLSIIGGHRDILNDQTIEIPEMPARPRVRRLKR